MTASEPTVLSSPVTSYERELAAIWTELLGSAPGPDEDFFAAGGDSIAAAALLARVCARLEVEVSLSAFVQQPTTAALAALIEAAERPVAPPPASTVPDGGDPARCSYAQERFWFIDQASDSNVVSNVSWALRLEGPLDVLALERALGELVLRHDSLRTRFELRDGTPVQLVSPESELTLEVAQVTDEAHATMLAAAAAQVPFDLTRGPLLRAQLLILRPNSCVLQFTAHHIVCDDWSKGVILSELAALYAAPDTAEQPSLPPPVQYPDYSRWQRVKLSEDVLQNELEHWRVRLGNAPAVELPVDRTRPPTPSMRGARLRTAIAPTLETALRTLGQEAGATFFMTMLAALQAFLCRYTRQEDLVIGTAIDNRSRLEFERAVGLFTNVLALRADLTGRPSFRELLSRARATTLDAIAHQDLPFDRLAASAPERDASRHPIFQVFYEFIVPAPLELALPGISSEPFEVPKLTSEFDLGLYLDEQRGGLDMVWEYSTDLFEPDTIERMADHFMRLLEEIVADPDRPTDELPLLDDTERRLILLDGNISSTPPPESCIHELFEAHVRATPEALALVAGDEQLSYSELNSRANSIAHLLTKRGITAGDAIGLCLERCADLVAAMLGILKAGGSYVPLHPDHPASRLSAQLETAGARMLVAGAPLEGFSGEVLSLEHERDHLAELPDADPERAAGPDDTAYVLYTSGSTGAPKGVAVTHRNLVNYTVHMIAALGAGGAMSSMHFGSVSAVSTDLGNTAIFPALAGGGCLHLIATDVATDGAMFASYVADRPLDVLKITPSHLNSLLDAAGEDAIAPCRWLIFGGEALSWELAERVLVAGGPRVINHYGPTEATIGCCTYELDLEQTRPPAATVPIGKPISGATAYVLDPLMQPVPVGVAGELYIGGAGVARGYVNQPEQTAEVFVADPFSEGPEARLYRTGDLARRLADANLEFLGRVDEQVKIRGFRVEPAEVQAVLMRESGVRQAAVLATGEGEGRRLVAYVVADEGAVTNDSLLQALAQTLPAYMVPSQLAMLDALPLTSNGKLDRSSLPSSEAPAAARTEPLTELEAQLAAVWAELLEHEVGLEENFFEAGGHSLLAIRLIARIRNELGVKLTLKALIDAPTISEFAAKLESTRETARQSASAPVDDAVQTAATPKPTPTVAHVPRDCPLRCSFAQEQFWLVDQLTPQATAYNFSWPMRLEGRLDADALGRAVTEIVHRHEALRTRFAATDGQPMQIVEKAGAAKLELVDLAEEPDPEGAARRLIGEQTATAFDLSRGPLLRVVLLRLGKHKHILLIVVHHIIFDGVSKVVLYRELGECYAAFAAGRQPSLPESPIEYADYAEWQRSQLDRAQMERELAHWRMQLDGAPTALELPTDRPRPAVASLRGARYRHPLSSDLRRSVEAVARGEGATFFMVVLATFEVLLYRYTGQEDLLVGTPVDTRTVGELEQVIGPFINTVVIRGEVSGSISFRDLLRGVHQRTLNALEHQDLPFERLVAAIAPERDLSRHPLFQTLLAVNPAETGLQLDGISVTDLDPEWSGARVDLFLILDDLPQGLEAIWEYSTDLFEPDTIERMADHFVRLLEEIVADPDRPIEELPLLGERERALLQECNQTAAEIPRQRLEQLVAEQARATPNSLAVRFEDRELSYEELDARANQLANRLQALGAGPDELVGVCLSRSEQLLVALLATMKAGAAYVPVDPGFPRARQEFMLADAQVRVLVTEEALLASLPASSTAVLCVDRDWDEVKLEPTAAPAHDADADDLAYVIYTSGSTGKPKGVEIPHRALVNFLCSMREHPGLAAEDVLVAVTTLSFDIAGLELYLPLITGAQVVIASTQTAADPRALARLLESSQATVMQATPTTWRMLTDAGWPGRAQLRAFCGGEALPPALADELVVRVPELWNMYGPTETTIWSSCARVRDTGEPPTIGRPITNTTLHVLDKRGHPTPIGVPGELVIGGAGLARGYRNRPELTAEQFVAGEHGTERLYHSGDLARYRSDGTVQFLGRIDHQVKLRGFRIELGEIETTLGGHPSVAAATAIVHEGAQGEPSLVAYVVPDAGPTNPEELRRFLAESLPAFMVPATIVELERLPLTPNGKIDRKALPTPQLPSTSEELYVEPRNATEMTVASVFCEVLGVDRAGAHNDFFELGGQSLLAARLISRLDARFEIELPLRALFEAPTVAGLAERVDALLTVASKTPEPAVPEPLLVPTDHTEPAPLLPVAGVRAASFAQERFWFLDQIGAGAAYNISWPLRMRGALDVVALERALNEVVRRHEVLRTRFAVEDGRPVQVIEPSRPVSVEFVDLSEEPDGEREAQRFVDERTLASFDLAEGPLIRASLLRLQPTDHILQVVVHHAVADGGSKVVFFKELGTLYGAYRDNRPAALPEPPIQYADFARWQRSALQGEQLERELAHWSSELDGVPARLELPSDHPRPAVATLRGGWLRTKLAEDTLAHLNVLALAEGATLFMIMLAAFEVLLYRYSGQKEIVVGTPVDTRGRAELEQLIGPFVNTLVLRGDLSGEPSFRELLGRVKQRTLSAIEHQALPFERLVEALAPERELGRHPLFQALIALNPPEPAIQLQGLDVEELSTEKTASRVDLTLLLQQRERGLDLVWEYSTDLFEPETMRQMAKHFLCLLESIVSHPEQPIDELPLLLSEGEPDRPPATLEQDERTFPVFCLQDRFEEQARQRPDAIAIRHDDESLSYRELNERANRLAHHLRALGVEPDALVALCLERSLELVVAVLAVLKAGGAYVPLDPEYPAERLAFVLDDCAAAVLITQEHLLDRFTQAAPVTVVCVDRDQPLLEAQSNDDPPATAQPENLAYVIYTSGSTGQPKGVLVEHRNVARLFMATDTWIAPGPKDTWTLLHSYAFDFSVWEIWGALLHGGTLVVVPAWTARSPDSLAQLLVGEQVTILSVTPSLFMTAMDELLAIENRLSLRLVVFGGEALHTRLLAPWFERVSDQHPQLVNMYGITETTVHVTYRPLTAADARRDGSPIGRPLPDLDLHVLDAKLKPVPRGVAGELFVGGAGLARGYLNRPQLSEQRFIASPFGAGRLYRTGDRARISMDGELLFEGRLDDQVKIRGFRIELGEVQATLAGDAAVAECAVIADSGGPGDTTLAAYVVATSSNADPASLRIELRERLRDKLPEYMIPSSFTLLAALPLTTNGKLDHRALPAPAEDRAGHEPTPPRTELERELADVWQTLLSVEVLGVDDDFFEMGGHSLLAAQLAARIRTKLGVDCSVRDVFAEPTVAGLARTLETAHNSSSEEIRATPTITARRMDEPWPLSNSQQQLWLIDQWDPGAQTYNVAMPFRIEGTLDLDALRRAVEGIVARHEILRTVVEVHDDRPVPVLLECPRLELESIDLRGHSEAKALEVLTDLARRPFDLARDPLLRCSVLRTADQDHILLIETHHISFDGSSERILLDELAALYRGQTMPELRLQFGDFALWEHNWFSTEEVQRELDWWRRQLAGARTSIELPVDRPRPQGHRFRGASYDLMLPAEIAVAVRRLCREESATPYMLILSALATLLYRITGQDDILIGSPVANRISPELETLIGFFSNTLVFRARMRGNPTFRELLRRVREMAIDVYTHQSIPFEKLVEAVGPERAPGMNPLFQVNLRVSTAGRPTLELPGLAITPMKVDSGLSRFDLALDIDVLEEGISGYFRYNRDIFEPATIARLSTEFEFLLRDALAKPDQPLLGFDLQDEWSDRRTGGSLRGFRARAREDTGAA